MDPQVLSEAVWSDCIPHTVKQAIPVLWSNKGEGLVFKLICLFWETGPLNNSLTTTSQVVGVRLTPARAFMDDMTVTVRTVVEDCARRPCVCPG